MGLEKHSKFSQYCLFVFAFFCLIVLSSNQEWRFQFNLSVAWNYDLEASSLLSLCLSLLIYNFLSTGELRGRGQEVGGRYVWGFPDPKNHLNIATLL